MIVSKLSLWPITKGPDNLVDQSQFQGNTNSEHVADLNHS